MSLCPPAAAPLPISLAALISKLPHEVNLRILEFAASLSTDTALALCLVSSWTRTLAIPRLYHTVMLRSPAQVCAFERCISSSSSISSRAASGCSPISPIPVTSFVHSLWISPDPSDPTVSVRILASCSWPLLGHIAASPLTLYLFADMTTQRPCGSHGVYSFPRDVQEETGVVSEHIHEGETGDASGHNLYCTSAVAQEGKRKLHLTFIGTGTGNSSSSTSSPSSIYSCLTRPNARTHTRLYWLTAFRELAAVSPARRSPLYARVTRVSIHESCVYMGSSDELQSTLSRQAFPQLEVVEVPGLDWVLT